MSTSHGAAASERAATPVRAGSPLIDFTRIVRMTPNVLVVPSVLWTTPCRSPRTNTLPSRCENPIGTKLPVTRRPLPVSPTIREVSSPWGVCATVRPAAAAGAAGAELPVAAPPETSATAAVTTSATSRATGPPTALFLKFTMGVFPPLVDLASGQGPESETARAPEARAHFGKRHAPNVARIPRPGVSHGLREWAPTPAERTPGE